MTGWQDLTIAAGQWVFVIALIPSLLSEHKPALWTSLLTGFVLSSFIGAFASLGLYYSALPTAICAGEWFLLALQRSLAQKLRRYS